MNFKIAVSMHHHSALVKQKQNNASVISQILFRKLSQRRLMDGSCIPSIELGG